MRLAPILPVLLIVLAACGSGSARTVATVEGQNITTADVQQYGTYAVQFYSWVRADGAVSRQTLCEPQATQGKCGALDRRVLARLIQERVALQYAHGHGIRLSPRDMRIARVRIAPYLGKRGARSSLERLGISAAFLRGVVERQMLIAKVEDAVTARQLAGTGPELRVERYLVSAANGQGESRRAAGALVSGGGPAPRGTQIQTNWVRSSDLKPSVWNVLQVAQPGQFTGPFAASQGYLVYRLLDSRSPADPLGSRQSLQLQYFKRWLQLAVRKAAPHCFGPGGRSLPCPSPLD